MMERGAQQYVLELWRLIESTTAKWMAKLTVTNRLRESVRWRFGICHKKPDRWKTFNIELLLETGKTLMQHCILVIIWWCFGVRDVNRIGQFAKWCGMLRTNRIVVQQWPLGGGFSVLHISTPSRRRSARCVQRNQCTRNMRSMRLCFESNNGHRNALNFNEGKTQSEFDNRRKDSTNIYTQQNEYANKCH